MNKERIDDLVDILGEEYAKLENTFVIKNNQQLCAYLDKPNEWIALQRKNRERYRKTLIKEARQQLKNLNDKAEKVFLLSYKEVAKDQIEITEKEIIAKNIPHEVREQIKAMKDFNAEKVAQLANQTLVAHTRQVELVDTLSTPDTLYSEVKDQMKKGIQNGIKVQYSNGRNVSWKAYMEMNIRTTIHQEIAQDQVRVGASVGQIFYYCDSFADDAPDHAPYTKKLYYNAEVPNIPDNIQRYIQSHNIKSMQEIMGAPVYLTTRPNCRHNFHAVALDEVMKSSVKEIGLNHGFIKGKYKGSNYEMRMKQRYNERMIRKYKLQKEDNEKMALTTGDKSLFNKTHDNFMISKWQAKQRQLIKENPNLLKRDYDRENPRVITQDLGVRYDYKFKNGEPIKK